MSKHTPGPWSWQGPISRNLANCLAGGGRPLLRCIDVSEADARLISAAPDLLAALQSVMTWWAESVPPNGADDDMPPQIFDAAHAAIAKATGEQM